MLDQQATGKVDAAQAAAFLKKSQLREPVLHKVKNNTPGVGGIGLLGLGSLEWHYLVTST